MSVAVRLAATVCSFAVFLFVDGAFADRILSDEEWAEDIDQYVALLHETHLNPFHSVREADFNAAVADLKARVPESSDLEIAFGLQRVVALVGDGHTWLTFGERLAPDRLPIGIYEFDDGVFVVAATNGLDRLVGAELLELGGRPVSELLRDAEPQCSRDNEWTVLARRGGWLTIVPFLEYAGAEVHDGRVAARLRMPDGTVVTERLRELSETERAEWVSNIVPPPDDALPLYRRAPDKTYWMEYLPDEKAVYVKFNAVQNAEEGPHLVGFSVGMMQLIEEERPKKLIIDARHNGGGNGDLLNPMVRRISENKRINRRGRLFVITGRVTFSAALMFTVRMERNTEALFVGEPGAGKPNSYGEFNRIELDNSKMWGSISSRWHEEGEPDDTREYVPVDIPAALTSADYFAGRDPCLEAIFAYRK